MNQHNTCCGRGGCPDCPTTIKKLIGVALEELQANLCFYKEDGGPSDYMREHVEFLEDAIKYLEWQLDELNNK